MEHHLAHTSPDELVELIEALSLNTSWSIENKRVLLQEWFEPYMEKGYYKYFKYVAPRLLRIIQALDKMEHYNTDTLFKFINQYSLLVHRKLDILHSFIQ